MNGAEVEINRMCYICPRIDDFLTGYSVFCLFSATSKEASSEL